MRDEDQIASLIFAYAERMDRGDFAGVGALFEHAVYRAEGGPPLEGSAAVEGLPLQPIVVGRYRDRFERGSLGWRFRERRTFVDLLGDVSRHLRAMPGRA